MTPARSLRVLLVEDSPDDAELLVQELRSGGCEIAYERVETADAMRSALARGPWDLVLCDYNLPQFSMIAALATLREEGLDLPCIIVSGTIGEEAATAAMRAGAHDYFIKGRLGARFIAAIDRELHAAQARRAAGEAAAAIERSRRQLEVIMRASRYILYYAEAHGQFRVLTMSPNVEDVLGYRVEEAVSEGFWADRIHPDDREGVFRRLDRIVDIDQMTLEYRFRHKDGSWRWMRDEFTVERDARGRPAFLQGGWADVTRFRELQEQLLTSDRMVSVGMMAAGVAHEINNPLAAALANLELAIGQVGETAAALGAGPAFEESLAEMRDARDAADRIRLIVRDLKMFSGTTEDVVEAVDVHEAIESSLRMASNATRHRARVVRDYGSPPPAWASRARLGQVFLNLIVNAAQAIPEGDTEHQEIRITTGTDAAGRVTVEVADTGTGMDAETLARLFTPFFTTKDVGVGTGLGLSISRRIVTDLGGTIEVRSDPGKGSVFRVILHAADPDAPAGEGLPVPPVPAASRRGKVLVVDDEEPLLALIERALEDEHDIIALGDAREALRRIRSGERFDAILSDLMMPNLTGMELHAILSREAADQAERMVFLTGGAFTPAARAFLDAVSHPRIEKPFELRQLRGTVNTAVARVIRPDPAAPAR